MENIILNGMNICVQTKQPYEIKYPMSPNLNQYHKRTIISFNMFK